MPPIVGSTLPGFLSLGVLTIVPLDPSHQVLPSVAQRGFPEQQPESPSSREKGTARQPGTRKGDWPVCQIKWQGGQRCPLHRSWARTTARSSLSGLRRGLLLPHLQDENLAAHLLGLKAACTAPQGLRSHLLSPHPPIPR